MRILIVYNHYGRQSQGGDAEVVEAEGKLLVDHGHAVLKYERSNAEIYEDGTLSEKIRACRDIAWSGKSYREIQSVIHRFQPDIMHVHNYWLALTPSVFAAAKDCGVATVFTLHNYLLICPGRHLIRNGRICNARFCTKPWQIMLNQCFLPEKNLLKSFLAFQLYRETKKRRFLEPWVDAYITLSSFGRLKFLDAGLERDKVFVKPNFIRDPLGGAQINQKQSLCSLICRTPVCGKRNRNAD